jgi:hypothetical protein
MEIDNVLAEGARPPARPAYLPAHAGHLESARDGEFELCGRAVVLDDEGLRRALVDSFARTIDWRPATPASAPRDERRGDDRHS